MFDRVYHVLVSVMRTEAVASIVMGLRVIRHLVVPDHLDHVEEVARLHFVDVVEVIQTVFPLKGFLRECLVFCLKITFHT